MSRRPIRRARSIASRSSWSAARGSPRANPQAHRDERSSLPFREPALDRDPPGAFGQGVALHATPVLGEEIALGDQAIDQQLVELVAFGDRQAPIDQVQALRPPDPD